MRTISFLLLLLLVSHARAEDAKAPAADAKAANKVEAKPPAPDVKAAPDAKAPPDAKGEDLRALESLLPKAAQPTAAEEKAPASADRAVAPPPALPEDVVEVKPSAAPPAPAKTPAKAPRPGAKAKVAPKPLPHAVKGFGEVVAVQGRATVGTSPLHAGTAVAPDDVITTGPRSFVRILLKEGIAMQVGPDSTVRLEKREDKPTTIDLVKGFLLSRIKKSSGTETKYRVRTRSAALGVRGTTFFAKEEKDGRTFLCVCEGKVEARWVRGGVAITTKHHDSPKWISQDNPGTEAAPMGHDHDDAQIEALDLLLQGLR